MDIIILYGKVFPVTRCSAVESWTMSVHLCELRKDPGSRFLPCNLQLSSVPSSSNLVFCIMEGYDLLVN